MKIYELAKKFKDYSIKEIIEYYDIAIIFKDMKSKTVQSRLLIDEDGYATIFISSSLENNAYINFLLAHELGHYFLHYDKDVSFSFISRVYKTRIEREANLFACEFLLFENIKQKGNIEFIVNEKGIPLKIWYSVMEKIKEDFDEEN